MVCLTSQSSPESAQSPVLYPKDCTHPLTASAIWIRLLRFQSRTFGGNSWKLCAHTSSEEQWVVSSIYGFNRTSLKALLDTGGVSTVFGSHSRGDPGKKQKSHRSRWTMMYPKSFPPSKICNEGNEAHSQQVLLRVVLGSSGRLKQYPDEWVL